MIRGCEEIYRHYAHHSQRHRTRGVDISHFTFLARKGTNHNNFPLMRLTHEPSQQGDSPSPPILLHQLFYITFFSTSGTDIILPQHVNESLPAAETFASVSCCFVDKGI